MVLTKNEVKIWKFKVSLLKNYPSSQWFLQKIEVKIWKFKVPAFFQFSRLFTVFPPFFNFPAFFGSSYHDVNNWRYEFNFSTTAHHGDVKVCTCMFSNIRKSMVKTRKSHLERFFPNECAHILTTCREHARTTCRERLNEWSMRRVSQKHTIGSGKGSFPNFLENTLNHSYSFTKNTIYICNQFLYKSIYITFLSFARFHFLSA